MTKKKKNQIFSLKFLIFLSIEEKIHGENNIKWVELEGEIDNFPELNHKNNEIMVKIHEIEWKDEKIVNFDFLNFLHLI